jgi:hypothetical protein
MNCNQKEIKALLVAIKDIDLKADVVKTEYSQTRLYSMEQSPSWEADQSSQLTKKFPAFYGTRRFFTVLTTRL